MILKGNLAPEGCVVKMAGHERMQHRGPARVFDREEPAFAAVKAEGVARGEPARHRDSGRSAVESESVAERGEKAFVNTAAKCSGGLEPAR